MRRKKESFNNLEMIKYLTISIFFTITIGCQSLNTNNGTAKKAYHTVEGQTMGTYYRVTYDDTLDLKPALDSILVAINDEVSTYIPESTISLFNKDLKGGTFGHGYFIDNFLISLYFFQISGGLYDPTVMPLVNYWGFGYSGKKKVETIDSIKIDEISRYIGLDKIQVNYISDSIRLKKLHPLTELDFSSVAKGYAVDVLAEYLELNKINNFLVDIGGEMRIRGLNPKGKKWSIGINTPLEGAALNEAVAFIGLSDHSIATSGNYRNFYENDGQKISHTINHKTGLPERSNLLSVTILANDCSHADAWATTCMVLGLEKSIELLSQFPDVAACLIYNKEGTLAVENVNNFENYILDQ
jgi:thiamine biosynthesis lipoprotein